jgi:hypothetical protein
VIDDLKTAPADPDKEQIRKDIQSTLTRLANRRSGRAPEIRCALASWELSVILRLCVGVRD